MINNNGRRMHKLLFTGGHHTSSVAVIDWLKDQKRKELEIYWIGRKEIRGEPTLEYMAITRRKIPFYPINAGKFGRIKSLKFLPYVIKNLFLIPIGFIEAFLVLLRLRPQLIVSMGGFISVPVVVTGRLMGIKAVTHEQTSTFGLATKINAMFLPEIYTTWPADYYDIEPKLKSKIKCVGLPQLQHAFEINKKAIDSFKINPQLITVLFFAGKEGSQYINDFVANNVETLLKNFNIILHCGSKKFDSRKVDGYIKSKPRSFGEINYRKYITDLDLGAVYSLFDFTVCRSGAHFCQDLILLNKPALMIPLSVTSGNEQYRNAKIVEKLGLAKVLDEDKLTDIKLISEILKFKGVYSTMKLNNKIKIDFTKGQETFGNEILKKIEAN